MYEKNAVLFVDDEQSILESIRRGLIDEEFRFFGAMSGQDAIDIMENNKIDVIVTDMRMPQMNGLQLLHEVSARLPKTVKIVLTGYTQYTQIIATINQVDIFRFLTKPWELEDLTAIIRKALDLYITQEENARYRLELEHRNRTYQALLRTFDDAVTSSKINNDFLGRFGRAMLDFELSLDSGEREKAARLLDTRGEVFSSFSSALSVGTTEFGTDELNRHLSSYLRELNPNMLFTATPDAQAKFNVKPKLLETLLAFFFSVFSDEFLAFGVRAYLGRSKDDKYSMIVQCPLGPGSEDGGDISALETKLRFITELLKQALNLLQIHFNTRIMSGSIFLCLYLESTTEKKQWS